MHQKISLEASEMKCRDLERVLREYFLNRLTDSTFFADFYDIYEIACWLKSAFEDINAIDSAEKMEIFMIDLDIQLYDHLNRHMKTFRPRIRRAIRYLENEGED